MKKVGKMKQVTIEHLVLMVKSGFDSVIGNMNTEFSEIKKRLAKLELGQEDIKLRLDQAAYRFELVELKKRVNILEKKVGIV